MPQYQQGMSYQNQGGAIIPIVSQADLDNLVGAGFNPINPATSTSSGGYQDTTGAWKYGMLPGQAPTPDFPTNLPNAESSITSSSTPVVNAENDLMSQINALTTGNDYEDRARTASTAFTDELQHQIDAFEKRREQEVASLNAEFDRQQRSLGEAQTRETGTTNVGLQRLGGYLGGSGSQMGVLQNLSNTHRGEVSALEAKRSAAIASANNAINEKQFALGQQKLKEAKDLEADIENRKNTFFTQAMSLIQEKRLSTASAYDIVKDIPVGQTRTVNGVTYTGIKEPEAFFKSSDLISIMKDLPQGRTETLTDPNTGEEYTITGMSSTDPSIKTIQSYNNAGKLTITSYKIDPATGMATIINQLDGGKIGAAKVSAGGGGVGANGIPNAFWSDAQKEVTQLQKGESWGTVWDRLKLKYPTVDGATVDIALGKSSGWDQMGKYEEWKQGQYKQTEGASSEWEYKNNLRSYIDSLAAEGKNSDELLQEIQRNGSTVDELYGYDAPYGL